MLRQQRSTDSAISTSLEEDVDDIRSAPSSPSSLQATPTAGHVTHGAPPTSVARRRCGMTRSGDDLFPVRMRTSLSTTAHPTDLLMGGRSVYSCVACPIDDAIGRASADHAAKRRNGPSRPAPETTVLRKPSEQEWSVSQQLDEDSGRSTSDDVTSDDEARDTRLRCGHALKGAKFPRRRSAYHRRSQSVTRCHRDVKRSHSDSMWLLAKCHARLECLSCRQQVLNFGQTSKNLDKGLCVETGSGDLRTGGSKASCSQKNGYVFSQDDILRQNSSQDSLLDCGQNSVLENGLGGVIGSISRDWKSSAICCQKNRCGIDQDNSAYQHSSTQASPVIRRSKTASTRPDVSCYQRDTTGNTDLWITLPQLSSKPLDAGACQCQPKVKQTMEDCQCGVKDLEKSGGHGVEEDTRLEDRSEIKQMDENGAVVWKNRDLENPGDGRSNFERRAKVEQVPEIGRDEAAVRNLGSPMTGWQEIDGEAMSGDHVEVAGLIPNMRCSCGPTKSKLPSSADDKFADNALTEGDLKVKRVGEISDVIGTVNGRERYRVIRYSSVPGNIQRRNSEVVRPAVHQPPVVMSHLGGHVGGAKPADVTRSISTSGVEMTSSMTSLQSVVVEDRNYVGNVSWTLRHHRPTLLPDIESRDPGCHDDIGLRDGRHGDCGRRRSVASLRSIFDAKMSSPS